MADPVGEALVQGLWCGVVVGLVLAFVMMVAVFAGLDGEDDE